MLQKIKNIAIAIEQYHNFRYLYRIFRLSNRRESELLTRQLSNFDLKGKLVFDVGANIGSVTESLLNLGARVVAVEPNFSLLSEIQARCPKAADLVILPVAISSRAAISKFYLSEYSGQSSFYDGWSDSEKSTQLVYVPTITFTEMINTFGTPYYIKIDVEGHEFDVVSGIPANVPLVSFEFHMNEERAREALKIIWKYKEVSIYSANILLEGESVFYFSKWLDASELEGKFLELCDKESGRSASYGQLFMSSRVVE